MSTLAETRKVLVMTYVTEDDRDNTNAATLERLIYNARTARANLQQHKGDLFNWLVACLETRPNIGKYQQETRLLYRALYVLRFFLMNCERRVMYFETAPGNGLYRREEETETQWEERNKQEASVLARNFIYRGVTDYQDRDNN